MPGRTKQYEFGDEMENIANSIQFDTLSMSCQKRFSLSLMPFLPLSPNAVYAIEFEFYENEQILWMAIGPLML